MNFYTGDQTGWYLTTFREVMDLGTVLFALDVRYDVGGGKVGLRDIRGASFLFLFFFPSERVCTLQTCPGVT